MSVRRLTLLLAVAVLALPMAACADKSKPVRHAASEGTYLDLGGLEYQVQVSRELNPNDQEDRSYLIGMPASERQLGPDQAWFAVFLRVENFESAPQPAASDFQVVDTQDKVYRPIPLADVNVFRYPGGTVLSKGATIPGPNTVPYNEPSIGGALLLFKIDVDSFENRPLELEITDPTSPQQQASVDLDL